ncbi:hypothetical protein AB0N42_30365 [Streptomyces pseudogriseolus]|uniref:hypothetical protein n=1 Tax=Streptomyces pseudogriseolus TaxID=36817 RepID=UPI003490FD9D
MLPAVEEQTVAVGEALVAACDGLAGGGADQLHERRPQRSLDARVLEEGCQPFLLRPLFLRLLLGSQPSVLGGQPALFSGSGPLLGGLSASLGRGLLHDGFGIGLQRAPGPSYDALPWSTVHSPPSVTWSLPTEAG